MRASCVGLFALVDGAARTPAWPTVSGGSFASISAHPNPNGARLVALGDKLETLEDADTARIRAQPVCIASSTWSFGDLGETLLFVQQRQGDQLRVGYFAYFDVERPWGDNLLTYSVLPAALIDATYSHFAFILPGMQRLLYGPGDVEGASVVYRVSDSGALAVLEGLADDDAHQSVALTQADLAGSDGRVMLMTSVWSHQLGARGAAAYTREPGARMRCFSGASLQPLTRKVADSFRLGSFANPLRARPAFHREAAGSGPRLARASL